ncbi:multidrug effflux MFS transporter [Megasphaera hominis]|jgi:DHA1 family bicyclomycin/chloramphenicol resistance-like MFS transporter|uniref:Bcr/CflA family efflux transporter n=1 Tax=Megasphaera hominis TaxID=159836 RepID=A0ABR6VHN4_9FIRM|nr:multidrug effflux MFS transporter [Megasphaera hominis]MBC3536726.1 multidrug effflux MFS transporter [Megasphaera hominis]
MVKTKQEKMMLWMTVFMGMLAAIAPLSTDMYLPGLPAMMADFAVSPSMIQLTLTASMAGMAASQIISGPVSDKKGRRRPLFLGMAIFSLSSLACILSHTIYWLLLFRFIQGFSGGAGIVIARAIARDLCRGTALTKLFSMLMLVNGLAPILAPVIGGQILRFSSWRGIFWLLVSIGIVLAVCAWLMPETLPQKRRLVSNAAGGLKQFASLFGDRYFMGHCIMQCFAFAAFFAYISGSSFVFQNVYHVSPQAFSLIFGLNGIGLMISGAVTGRLTGRIADWRMLRVVLWVALIGSGLLLLGFLAGLPVYAIITILFFTVATLASMSTTSFSLAMQAQGKQAGSASALIGFFSMISGAVMAPVVGIAGSYTAIPMGLVMVFGEAGALLSFYFLIYPAHTHSQDVQDMIQ